mmetsp:Transcript_21425/g.63942  ORF Transcript_21425/g.63942 Transcript_21425/m.63942 type:complete len:587 (+) Transcript_21425:893-2653(+)
MAKADAPNRWQLVGNHAVEERGSSGTLDAVVREGPVAESRVVNNLLALAPHGLGVARAVEGGEGVLEIHRLGVEPARGLPAVREAELRPAAAEHVHDGLLRPIGVEDRSRPRAVLVEVGRDVVPAVGLLHLVLDPLRRGPGPVAGRVRLHELVGGLAVLHPVNDVAAEPGCVGDAVRLGAGVPVVRPLVRGPDEVIAVRGPARGPVQHGLDARGLQGGHEGGGGLHAVHDALDVALPEVVGQLRRHPALPRGRRQLHVVLALVRPHEEALALVPEVIRAFQVADHRQLVAVLLVVLPDLGDGLRDDVLVLQDGAGRVHSRELADALRPEARAVDDAPGADDVLLALALHPDLPGAIQHAVEPHHLGVLEDAPTEGLRLGREGLRHRRGVDVAVALGVEGADDAVHVHEGVKPLHLLGADEVQLRATEEALVQLGLAERVVRLLQPLLVLQQADGARLVEGERDVLLVLPLFVQVHALLVPELEVVPAVVVGDQACSMPRRTGCQRGLLEDRCGLARARPPQFVEDGRTRDTPANDRHVDVAREVLWRGEGAGRKGSPHGAEGTYPRQHLASGTAGVKGAEPAPPKA